MWGEQSVTLSEAKGPELGLSFGPCPWPLLLLTPHFPLLTAHSSLLQWQEQLCADAPAPAGASTTGSDLLGSSIGRSPA
jgi:hypothetical protein